MWIIKKTETNVTFVKIRSKTNPHLYVTIKNEQGERVNEDISAIEGVITGIYFKSYISTETKEEIEVVNIKIQDGDEVFILQSAWTFALRNVVNCILGCGDELGRVRIGIYGKINGDKTYPAVAFKNNGQKTNWLLDVEQQKEFTTPITNPKTGQVKSYDYSELNAFFKGKLIELNDRLVAGGTDDLDDFLAAAEDLASVNDPAPVSAADKLRAKATMEDVADDLPF